MIAKAYVSTRCKLNNLLGKFNFFWEKVKLEVGGGKLPAIVLR